MHTIFDTHMCQQMQYEIKKYDNILIIHSFTS